MRNASALRQLLRSAAAGPAWAASPRYAPSPISSNSCFSSLTRSTPWHLKASSATPAMTRRGYA